MTKKTSQKIPYYRILEIDAEIATGHYPNRSSLAEKLEVSISTIQHDIDFMRDILNAPIEHERDPYKDINGYYYTEDTFRLPAIYANKEEIEAVDIALELLAPYQNTSVYKKIKKVFEHFDEVLYDNKKYKDRNKNNLKNRIIFMEEELSNEVHENLILLMASIKKDYFITFEYKGHNKEDYIAPYQLLLKSGNWILIGYNETTDKVKKYNLDLIKSIEITKEHFKMSNCF